MKIQINGLREFERALERNPEVVKREVSIFLKDGINVYNKLIIRNPWRLGMKGGGSPVRVKGKRGGNLRDTHVKEFGVMEALIKPTAPYAEYVHEGTYKMGARPWLDYTKEKGQREIDKLSEKMVVNIVEDLVK